MVFLCMVVNFDNIVHVWADGVIFVGGNVMK